MGAVTNIYKQVVYISRGLPQIYKTKATYHILAFVNQLSSSNLQFLKFGWDLRYQS